MPQTFFHNGTLIDGTGKTPIANGGLLIEDNRIIAVGAASEIELGQDVTRIDAQGGTIMPGLIDTHVHIMLENPNIFNLAQMPFSLHFYRAVDYMRRTLDAGITTVRDAGGADLGVKQAVEDGLVAGPRMQISISILSITGGHADAWLRGGSTLSIFGEHPGRPDGICDGVDEVRKKVREVLRAGADIIKICSTGGVLSPTDHPEFTNFTVEELQAAVQEADFRRGIKVMAHAQGTQGIKNAVKAGIHSIEHGLFLDDEAVDMMLANGTYLVPTLLAPVAVLENPALPDYALAQAEESVEAHQVSIAKAYQAGVRIAMGTDAGVMPHGTNLRELGLMVDIGMSPMEALVATTKTAAECMGWDDRIGTLEVGKLADVVVSKTDPIADIRSLENTDNIVVVMQDGKLVKDLMAS